MLMTYHIKKITVLITDEIFQKRLMSCTLDIAQDKP
jgi:hypothetical protein